MMASFPKHGWRFPAAEASRDSKAGRHAFARFGCHLSSTAQIRAPTMMVTSDADLIETQGTLLSVDRQQHKSLQPSLNTVST